MLMRRPLPTPGQYRQRKTNDTQLAQRLLLNEQSSIDFRMQLSSRNHQNLPSIASCTSSLTSVTCIRMQGRRFSRAGWPSATACADSAARCSA